MKTKIILTEEGAVRLLAEVIKQSVDDYRAYEKRGLIVSGRVTMPVRPSGGGRAPRIRGLFVERHDCEKLVAYFRAGGPMDELLAAGGLQACGDAIRKRLGMPRA